MTSDMPRRWLSERAVLEEMERLNDLSMELTQDYKVKAVEAAQAEAEHKRLRAKRILSAKAGGEAGGRRVSQGEAETVAEADDHVADAYLMRLVSAAEADAIKETMRSVRTNQDGMRTAAASHRDQISGPGWSGK
jgi:hypothetical protein